MKNILLFLIMFSAIPLLSAQDTDSAAVTFSGYFEPYYAYDFGNPGDHNRPGFLYSHNRHNEFNLNIGFIKAGYSASRVRGNLALMAGTYANANLAAEPGVLKNIFEANAGIKLARNAAIWLDAGIFASHIGWESAIGKDNWTLTRSIVADNSPYYESGARLSGTTADGKWYAAVLALNGWQRIARPDGNNTFAGGVQVTWKPNSVVTLNYSNFIGNDKPDSVRQTRIYNDVYGIFQISSSLGLILGFDYGMEETLEGDDWNTWYTPVAIVRYTPSPIWAFSARGEYYADDKGVIIATGTPNGFKTTSFSLGVDYKVRENALLRLEVRNFTSKDAVFTDREGAPTDQNFFITTAIAVGF